MSDNQYLLERYLNEDAQPEFACRLAVSGTAKPLFAGMRSVENQVRMFEDVVRGDSIGFGRETTTDVVAKCFDFFKDADMSLTKVEPKSDDQGRTKDNSTELAKETKTGPVQATGNTMKNEQNDR